MVNIFDVKDIIGKYVNLRNVRIDDAEFILSLRCDEKKNRFIHKTEYDIEKQKEYIKNYYNKNEYYFISENKAGEKIGTIRLYGLAENSFIIGSWLMADNSPMEQVLETETLARMYGFEELKLDLCKFEVRKENKKVIKYHKLMGATIIGETEFDYLFECAKDDYLKNIRKFLTC